MITVQGEIDDLLQQDQLSEQVQQVIMDSIFNASNGSIQGLASGTVAPNFTLPSSEGKMVSLYDYLDKGPVILYFSRGEWCPFCTIELKAMQRVWEEFKKYNASILTIIPQDISYGSTIIHNMGLDFEVLSDHNQNVMKAYDVCYELPQELIKIYREKMMIDLERLNANGEWNLPVPAIYIIDEDKEIKSTYFNHNYMVQAEPVALIQDLNRIFEAKKKWSNV